jgi:acetyl-CoA carboxylase carboxyl transferase subunit beta
MSWKTKLKDAVRTGVGKSKVKKSYLLYGFCLYWWINGAVVGEKISRRNQSLNQNNIPFVMISKSGGARMMEAAYSLMQLKHL